MFMMELIAQGVSAVLFLWFGVVCVFSKTMVLEFDRYGLPNLRVLTGVLQVAGAIGLIAGHFYRPLLFPAAGGLALMMLIAFVTRLRIRDSLLLAVPSFSLFLLNAYVFAAALRR